MRQTSRLRECQVEFHRLLPTSSPIRPDCPLTRRRPPCPPPGRSYLEDYSSLCRRRRGAGDQECPFHLNRVNCRCLRFRPQSFWSWAGLDKGSVPWPMISRSPFHDKIPWAQPNATSRTNPTISPAWTYGSCSNVSNHPPTLKGAIGNDHPYAA